MIIIGRKPNRSKQFKQANKQAKQNPEKDAGHKADCNDQITKTSEFWGNLKAKRDSSANWCLGEGSWLFESVPSNIELD